MYELELGGHPPSVNTTKGQHWAQAQKTKAKWQSDIYFRLIATRVPKNLARVQATAVCYVADNRRRDEGNYRPVLEKALGDALQLGGWLADDTPDYFRFGQLSFVKDKEKAPLTVITLDVEEPA